MRRTSIVWSVSFWLLPLEGDDSSGSESLWDRGSNPLKSKSRDSLFLRMD